MDVKRAGYKRMTKEAARRGREVLDELQPGRATYDELGRTTAPAGEAQVEPGPREQPARAVDPAAGQAPSEAIPSPERRPAIPPHRPGAS
jgi:hypothetical protein